MEYLGLLGLIGLGGLLGLKEKVDPNQGGAMVRLLGVFGFLGLGGFLYLHWEHAELLVP